MYCTSGVGNDSTNMKLIKPTYEQIILKVLEERPNDWIPSYYLVKLNTRWGFLGSSADRIARYMAEDGKIERKRDGKYTYYSQKTK